MTGAMKVCFLVLTQPFNHRQMTAGCCQHETVKPKEITQVRVNEVA